MLFRALLAGLVGAALLPVAASAQQSPLERGRYLVQGIVGCGNCHTPKGPQGELPGMELAGGFKFDEKPFTAYAPNITPDAETGIGRWTDAQIARATRECIRPDGSVIGPPMPCELYRGLSDGDLAAIVAYLRATPAVKNTVPKSVYRIPLPPNYGPPVASVAEVPRTDKVKYGAYLAGPAGHCIECHTPMKAGGHRDYDRTGLGGQTFEGPWGVSVARNITPHPTEGIGGWSDAEIKRAIQDGVRKDGSRLSPPMGYPYYKRINAEDMDALVAYLRSLKPQASR